MKIICIAGLVAAVSLNGFGSSILANFDFENHAPGTALGGSVGTPRVNTGSELGAGFDFNHNGTLENYTVSALSVSDTIDLNRTGANVRSDTIASTVPGGSFLEISPHRLENQKYGDIAPEGAVDYLHFSVQAANGNRLNLQSFSFALGVGRGSDDTAGIAFRGQGWFSTDGGSSWTKMRPIVSVNNTEAESFTGFSTFSADLGDFPALQNQSGEIRIALSLSDNSTRNIYSSVNLNPAGLYLDDIQLVGEIVSADQ